MPELRKDPIIDRWVIVAPERALRPNHFVAPRREIPAGPCNFCEGQEASTPGELLAVRPAGLPANGPGWIIRVVPNRYPAVTLSSAEGNLSTDDLYQTLGGFGDHEVIIESPRHVVGMSSLRVSDVRDLFWTYRERVRSLKQDHRLRSALIFKNVGAAGGATLEHAHSQLVALPIIPRRLADELAGAEAIFRRSGRCVFCDLVASERRLGQRMTLDGGSFVAFCPHAARTPYETWILPTKHQSHFEDLADSELDDLAKTVAPMMTAIEGRLDPIAYNYVIHSAPFDTTANDHYHWHIEIIPRVTTIAGFEWGSEMAINPLPPEDAAATLAADVRRK